MVVYKKHAKFTYNLLIIFNINPYFHKTHLELNEVSIFCITVQTEHKLHGVHVFHGMFINMFIKIPKKIF